MLSAAQCTTACARMAGSQSADCAEVCGATCAERCADLNVGVGSDGLRCGEMCSMTCVTWEGTYGANRELCAWIVENRPSPRFTPRRLRRP